MKRESHLYKLTAFFVFWLLFYLLVILGSPIHDYLKSEHLASFEFRRIHSTHLKSEYGIYEQLSKYYLFIIVLIATNAYSTFKESRPIKLSICFLLLGLIMYLSESNVIMTIYHPFYGVAILSVIFILLIQSCSWLALTVLGAGTFFVSGGVLTDYVHEIPFFKSHIPLHVAAFMDALKEERMDVIGQGFMCLSAVYAFWEPIRSFVRNNNSGTLLLLFFSALLITGNGFLHYGYEPNIKLEILALLLTTAGCAGLILTNKKCIKDDFRLTLISEEIFIIFLLAFFVGLPTIIGKHNQELESQIFWPVIFLFMAYFLYQAKMPAQHVR